jgi:hypothetical protein
MKWWGWWRRPQAPIIVVRVAQTVVRVEAETVSRAAIVWEPAKLGRR